MKTVVASIEPHRDKLGIILLVMSFPLLPALIWAPWWVFVLDILLVPIAMVLLLSRLLPSNAVTTAADESEIHMARKLSSSVVGLLSRWSQVSTHSHAHLEEAHSQVDEVIAYSEAAVIRISNNFIAITRKTRKQVEHALGLLESTKGTNTDKGGSMRHSLPALIHEYERLLQQVTTSLSDIAEKTKQLEQSHDALPEMLRRIEQSLDKFSDTTKLMDGVAQDNHQLVATALAETQHTHNAYRLTAQQASEVAQAASAEVSKLTGGMRRTGDEVAEALVQIRALGDEIQADINSIIIDLQFQDFTQQKLQRLKNPVLAELTDALREIFEEARSMSSKLENSGLIDPNAKAAIDDANNRINQFESFATKPHSSQTPAEPRNDRKAEGDDSVELF